MAESRSERAPAKLNLDLLVTARRPDGYHELDSLVVFADVADVLTVSPAERLTFDVEGPFAAEVPAGDGNIVLRAVRKLAEIAGIRPAARIVLEKHLPVAAGLGGGSADAAAALRALDAAWDLGLGADGLRRLALGLGADVPACVEPRTVRMRGVGDHLDEVPGLPELPLLLVNPGVAVATADVFAGLAAPNPTPRAEPLPVGASLAEFTIWLASSRNDLEPPALALEPAIGEALGLLGDRAGCTVARMSGSGATCYALFDSEAALRDAARMLQLRRPRWWFWSGLVRP